jgi:glycerol uptake operon antiterminator
MKRENIILPRIIPSIQNNKDMILFPRAYKDPWVLLKIGDINTLPNIIRRYHSYGVKVIVHQDSIKGLGTDKSGIHYLAKIGADAVDTTKLKCINAIKQENMIAIACLFIIDNISTETSIKVIRAGQPDYAVLMPSCLPEKIISHIKENTNCPLYGGGLCDSKANLEKLLQNGLSGTITSERSLWNKKSPAEI